MTEQTELCQCGDRPRTECPEEWEPGCDLGANEKFAQPYRLSKEEQEALKRALMNSVTILPD